MSGNEQGCGMTPFMAVLVIRGNANEAHMKLPVPIKNYLCGEPFPNTGNRYFCEDCARRLGYIW